MIKYNMAYIGLLQRTQSSQRFWKYFTLNYYYVYHRQLEKIFLSIESEAETMFLVFQSRYLHGLFVFESLQTSLCMP